MCASHDPMGALTLVVSNATWNLVPANLTNPVNMLNDHSKNMLTIQKTC